MVFYTHTTTAFMRKPLLIRDGPVLTSQNSYLFYNKQNTHRFLNKKPISCHRTKKNKESLCKMGLNLRCKAEVVQERSSCKRCCKNVGLQKRSFCTNACCAYKNFVFVRVAYKNEVAPRFKSWRKSEAYTCKDLNLCTTTFLYAQQALASLLQRFKFWCKNEVVLAKIEIFARISFAVQKFQFLQAQQATRTCKDLNLCTTKFLFAVRTCENKQNNYTRALKKNNGIVDQSTFAKKRASQRSWLTSPQSVALDDSSVTETGLRSNQQPDDKTTRTIVITSGKGGVGKTTTTANLGMSIARLGYRVTLIDADIGLRNLDLLLGLENRVLYTAMDIFEGDCRLDQALIRDKRLKNLCLLAISKNRQRYNVTRQKMDSLISSICALGSDFILIDCPAGIDIGFINAISPAQEALIITTPEITAMRDADRVAGLLEANGIYNAKLLINRVRPDMIQRHDMMSVQDVQDVLGIPLLGAIPEDLNVIISTNRGEPLVLSKKLSLSGVAFENAARRLVGKQEYLIDLKSPYKNLFHKMKTLLFNT